MEMLDYPVIRFANAQGTLQRQPIWGQICKICLPHIRHTDVPKQIGRSQSLFKKIT